VAAAELALMAGADRVEGTLFGNGERTGNVDIVTLAMNLYTHGIHPRLDFSNIDQVIECVEFCNRMPVHQRHPYAGQMVFTAFSGSHQDAIKKGFAAQPENGMWEVPYLPIDPKDLGRSYEAVIRVNSQSGKGGVAAGSRNRARADTPRRLQIEFSRVVQQISEAQGGEVTSEGIWATFKAKYLDRRSPFILRGHQDDSDKDTNRLTAKVTRDGVDHVVSGSGNGPLEAFIDGFQREFGIPVRIADYQEHAIGNGANALAISFVEAQVSDAQPVFGVGMHISAVNGSMHAAASGGKWPRMMASGARPLATIAPMAQAALATQTVAEYGDTVSMVTVSLG
jgi:2-isopropylmalate synthase